MFRAVLTLSLGAVLSLSAELRLNDLLAGLHKDKGMRPFGPRPEYLDDDVPYNDIDATRTIMARVRKGAGNCYAQGKCLYYSKKMKAEFCGTCGKPPGCFPGTGRVLRDNGDVVSMDRLKVHDRVLAASRSGDLTFSPVVSWLDKRSNDTTAYLRVRLSSHHQIGLSANHVLLVRQGDRLLSRFAGDLQIGDVLKVADSLDQESWASVLDITHFLATGAYVPLTAEGTIVVDGVLASCYASFDHDWAHALTAPLRWFPTLFAALEGRADPDLEGPRASVETLKRFGEWLFPTTGTDRRARKDDSLVQIPLHLGVASQ